MNNVMFLYNILITVILAIGLSGFFILYKKNHKKHLLYITFMFVLMIVDNSTLYISEFSENFYLLYENSKLLYVFTDINYAALALLIRFSIKDVYSHPITKIEKISLLLVTGLITLSNVFTPTFIPYEIGEFVFYFSLFLVTCYLLYLIKSNMAPQPEPQKKIFQLTPIVIPTLFVVNLMGIVESYIYYIHPLLTSTENLFGFEYRFISIEILKFIVAVIGLKYLFYTFESIFDKVDPGEQLTQFSTEYALTVRQKEIVALIISGKSNKEIGELLHITEGTVKTHVYNIFKKTDVTCRNQLIHKIRNK